jgi:hypothetical protein
LLANATPGADAQLLFRLGPACPPPLLFGCNLYVSLSPFFQFLPAGTVPPSGGLLFPAPIAASTPLGITLSVQFWTVAAGNIVAATDGLTFTVGLP